MQSTCAGTMTARDTLQRLQAELRLLRRQARTWRPGRGSILEPTTKIKLGTVLIFSLSQDAALASLWGQRQQETRRRHDGLWPATVTPMLVRAWWDQYQGHPRITAAMSSLSNQSRREADEFLMESLLAEEVVEQNRKGIVMCPKLLLESYMRKWRTRPRAVATDRWLCDLETNQDLQTVWRRAFRRRWRLEWSNLPEFRCLGQEDIKARTEAYLRWVRWVLDQIGPSLETVVVNMDETMVSNVKDRKKGVVVNRKRKKVLDNENNCKRNAAPRCSLLACITDDPDLQGHLPQILLPKGEADKQPPHGIREVFLKAGAPIEAWHGTSGFLSAAGAASFLTRLRSLVRRHRPAAQLVVIWDASMAHTNKGVLRHARRLGIRIVLVPGRLTWFLQPLDVYVFAFLKRHLRYALARERMRVVQAKLSVTEQLTCCTEAVRATLAARAWSEQMRKCGVSRDGAGLHHKLAALVRNSDLAPRPPTCEELQTFMGCSSRRAARVHKLLVEHPGQPPASNANAAATTSDTHLPSEGHTEMSSLRPVLEPTTRSSTVISGVDQAGQPAGRRRLPVGRRLTPTARNFMVRPLPPNRQGMGRATRSQRPPLVPGVLETESQTRPSRAESSWE